MWVVVGSLQDIMLTILFSVPCKRLPGPRLRQGPHKSRKHCLGWSEKGETFEMRLDDNTLVLRLLSSRPRGHILWALISEALHLRQPVHRALVPLC